MGEKFRPLSAEFLAEREECCTRGCVNCPYVPRHEGGKTIDEAFVSYALEHPELTYQDYVVLIKGEGKVRD